MNTDLKHQLLKQIQEINDDAVLAQVKALLDLHSAGRTDRLPISVKEAVHRGYEQSTKGKGRDHESVRNWLALGEASDL